MSLGVVIVDDPSAGKSEAANAAAEILGDPPVDVLVDWPVGSGEGIVEAYLEETSEVIDGKKTQVKKQAYRGIHFYIDEGDQLEALSKQQASTLISNLKTLLMSGGTGTAKADKRQSRRLQKLNYTAGLSISIQPAKAGFLFDDLKGGFPQRLLFATGGDPGRPPAGQRPKTPGPLDYQPLPPLDYLGVTRYHELTFPPEVWEYFDKHAVDAIDGKHGDELDGHAGILTAKTAALLAVLERRTDVTLDDWNLARQIVDYSKAVRTWLRKTLSADDEKREAVATVKAVKRNRALIVDSERRALEAAVRAVARKAARNRGQTLSRSDLHSAVASDNRKLVTMDDVIAEAVTRGHIIATADGRYSLGAKPL